MKNTVPYHTNAARNLGFTLIEIIVVVLIIALIATFFVSTISSNTDRSARLESQRFMAVVSEVRDESIIVGEMFVMTLDLDANSYGFSGLRANRSLGQDSGLFKTRGIKPGVTVKWEVFELVENEDEDEEEGEAAPRVLITPLGEITPFDVEFSGEQVSYHVFVNDENQLQHRSESIR